MKQRQVNVNGRALTESEAMTLRMMFDMVSIDLQNFAADRALEGLTVGEHLENLKELAKLFGSQ